MHESPSKVQPKLAKLSATALHDLEHTLTVQLTQLDAIIFLMPFILRSKSVDVIAFPAIAKSSQE